MAISQKNEIRRTDWVQCGPLLTADGYSAYRVWMAKTEFGMSQRHEWRWNDGTVDMDDWFAVPTRDFNERMCSVTV